MTAVHTARARPDRGASAVELAIVLPVLLLLLFGIIEFGRGYNVKVQLTGSVREGARELALGRTPAQARAAVKAAAPGLNPALSDADISTTACPTVAGPDDKATVTVSYSLASLTPIVPSGSITINVTGVMRCGL